MLLQLSQNMRIRSQKSVIVICLVLMLFMPISISHPMALHASLDRISADNGFNLPLAIPTTNKINPIIQKESTNNSVDNVTINSQKNGLRINDQVSTLATCDKLQSSTVTASGNDGNLPTNVIDNNLNTRWSNLGSGSWLQLDLGAKKSICSVDIAWYRGDMRENNFTISVSDDGNTFTNIFSATSSGNTASPEKYTLPSGTEGRYLRITVNGNTENQWASITEVSMFGGASSGGGGGTGGDVIGSLFHKWQNSAGSNTWSPYSSLGSSINRNTDSSIAMNTDGRLQAFIVDPNNQLQYKTQTSAGSSTWSSGWTSLGGAIKADTSPAVARNSDGRLQVFVVGTDNQLYTLAQTSPGSSTWSSSWTSLGGSLRANTDPTVISNNDGRLQVFVIDTNNAITYKSQTSPGSSTWSTSWLSLGGPIRADTSPAVAKNSDGRLQVVIVGTNNQLYFRAQTSPGSSTWSSSWVSLSGTLRANSDPTVISNNDGRLQVFVVGTNNQLYYKTQASPGSSTWSSGWTSLGGAIKADTSPTVARNSDGKLQIFIVSTNNGLYSISQTAAGSSTWSSSWTSLGGSLRDKSDPAVVPNADSRLDAFVVGPKSSGPPNQPPTSTDFPYAFVGSPQDMEDEGWGTRHYASGKPDDITHEWSGETSAQNYAIIIDITLTEIDHDDTISFKFGGTHMGSGWYDNTYSFESGEACIGKEEDHPSTDLCVVTGNSIGNLVNTPVKLAAVNIGKGEKLEMYSNLGSGWTKDVESSNGVDGFRPQVNEDEVVIRIDAAPGIVMRSAQIVEIDPASAGITTPASATTLTPTSSGQMASTEDDGWTEGDYEGSLGEQEEHAQEDWEDAGRPGDK
jgi:hypothetical protein